MLHKVGDKVLIIKMPKINGSSLHWTKEMDQWIGKEVIVKIVQDDKYMFYETGNYGWVEEWVEDPLLTFLKNFKEE